MAKTSSPTIGAKQELKVKELKKDFKNWYYVVDYDGQEYKVKLFDFQKTQETPSSVTCMLKTNPDGTQSLTQDLVPLIASRYKVGETYSLNVKRSMERSGQYDAFGSEGFRFHFVNSKGKKYGERQTLLCRVTSIDGIKVNVEEAEETKKTSEPIVTTTISPQTLKAMGEAQDISPAIIRMTARIFWRDPAFYDARQELESQSGEWLTEAVRVVEDHMGEWLSTRLDTRKGTSHRICLLNALRRMGIEVLERSGLVTGQGEDMTRLRSQIASCIGRADEFTSAINKIKDKTIDDYASDIRSSLERTGYVYEAAHRLGVLSCAMEIDSDLMVKNIRLLFVTLSSRSLTDWRQEPLRGALVKILMAFIDRRAEEADRVMNIGLGENKAVVSDMTRALAMTLLLTDEGDRGVNRYVLMSRLCRYASLFHTNLSATLNSKAYGYLFGNAPSQLPFGWNDMKSSADVISFKASQAPTPQLADGTLTHVGRNATVSVNGNNVTISPRAGGSHLRNVLPDGIPGWRNIEVKLSDRDSVREVKGDCADTQELRLMWRDVEDSLMDERDGAKRQTPPLGHKVKLQAEEGDEVMIMVTGSNGTVDEWRNPIFHCVVVDDHMTGRGLLSPRDIVRYNVLSAHVSDFMDDSGKPLLLRAVVRKVLGDGTCRFKLVDYVEDFVSRYAQTGEPLLCRMTISSNRGNLLISEKGYSLKVPTDDNTPPLKSGDIVWVEPTAVYADGKVDAEFIEFDETGETLSDRQCFHNMLMAYSDGKTFDGDPEENDDEDEDYAQGQDQAEMARSEVSELMNIVDRQSTLTGNRAQTFNLLAVARLLAIAIGDAAKADEYHERMALIYMMDEYARNQWIDPDDFDKHFSRSAKMLEGYPDMQDQATRLFCLSRLERSGSEARLLEVAEQHKETLTGSVARLTLAFNLADGYHLTAARREIRNKINELLGIEAREESEREHMGEEGPTQEFKESMVFPPDNSMRPDKQRQTLKLLTVICGMMNTKGGRLLVGVNDSGMAVGLDSDFRELAGTERFDEQKSRDLMSNFFTDMMRKHMPNTASLYVDTHFESHGGRMIFVVEVTPTPTEVMNVDEVSYRRVGSTTRPMDENEKKSVMELKKQQAS